MVHQDGHDGPVLSMDLRSDPASPLGEVRRAVRGALATEHEDCVADVELLVTELVSNAYDHGRAPRDVRIRRSSNPPVVRIEVSDASRQDLPVLGTSRLGGARGRGMVLVDALAHRWGIILRQAGKTVWAEVTCQALTPAPDPAA